MRYFQTRTQASLAEVFGETSTYGVDILSWDDDHPRFTEEEERFHGALIGNTPYGLLQSIFVEHSSDQAPNGMPLLGFPGCSDADSNNPELNRRSKTRAKYYRDLMLLRSSEGHEVVAKFLGFLNCAPIESRDGTGLNDLLDDACVQFPLLKELMQLVGNPLTPRAIHEKNFLFNFIYSIGKAAFFTTELSRLNETDDIGVLRSWVLEGDFFDHHTPSDRVRALVRGICREDIDQLAETFYLGCSEEGADERKAAIAALAESSFGLARQVLTCKGIETADYAEGFPLSKQAYSFAMRLHWAFSLSVRYLGLGRASFSVKDGTLADLTPTEPWTPWGEDPSTFVCYQPRSHEERWGTVISMEGLEEVIAHWSPSRVLCFPIPDHAAGQVEMNIVLLTTSDIVLASEKTLPDHPVCLRLMIPFDSTFRDALSILKNCHCTSVLIAPHDHGISSMRASMAERFSEFGSVVFLDVVGDLGHATSATGVEFSAGHRFAVGGLTLPSSPQLYFALLKVYEWDDSEFVALSCVPRYFKTLFDRYVSAIPADHPFRPQVYNGDDRMPSGKLFSELFDDCMAVFEVGYLRGLFPPSWATYEEDYAWDLYRLMK